MKKVRLLLIAILTMICAFSVASCSKKSSPPAVTTFTVMTEAVGNGQIIFGDEGGQYNSGDAIVDGTTVTVMMLPDSGHKLTKLALAYLDGSEFASKDYTDATGLVEETFDITQDVMFKAYFEQAQVAPTQYNVSVTSAANGTVTTDHQTAIAGTTINLTVSPDNGYEVEYVKWNGNALTGPNYSFTMPEENVTITYAFKSTAVTPSTYNVSVTSSAGGTVTPSKTQATAGETITLNATPNTDYVLSDIKVNNGAVTVSRNGNTATFTMPASAVTVTYTFTKNVFAINLPTSVANGTISSSVAKQTVGQSVTLTLAPASGYRVASLVVDGVNVTSSLTSANKYTFDMPSKDVAVTVAFEQIPVQKYGITVSNVSGSGSAKITVDGVTATQAEAGKTVTVELTGTISNVTFSSNVTDVSHLENVYTFTMPAGAVTISVTWGIADNRTHLSHLILGDSYTDLWFWNHFEKDMKDLPSAKSIGIGGTVVDQWKIGLNANFTHDGTNRDVNIERDYNVDNFVFHIGVNDIDGGETAESVIADLKAMFTLYNNAYPNAKIYWVSLSLNTMFDAAERADYLAVNAAIKEYASQTSYLTYIDTCSVMFPESVPNGDWFADALHFNYDGYATWSSLICEALGYPRQDVASFGSAGVYYSSNTWSVDANGVVSNETPDGQNAYGHTFGGEQSLWFDGVYSDTAYAEMMVSVNAIANADPYPKFGLAIKGQNGHVFFYLDVNTSYQVSGGGVTYRAANVGQAGWLWDGSKNLYYGGLGELITVSNDSYCKIAILKSGSDLYFYVNDIQRLSITGLVINGIDLISGPVAIGLTTFNIDVSIKSYSATSNLNNVYSGNVKADVASKYLESSFAEVEVTNNWARNNGKNGESSTWAAGINHSKFYVEADINLIESLKINPTDETVDKYPKAGIGVFRADGGLMYFYIDAVNDPVGSLGNNMYVGFAYRPAGMDSWSWGDTKVARVDGLKYTGTDFANIALLKDGANYTFVVNDKPVLDVNVNELATRTTADYTNIGVMANEVNVSIMAFNLKFEVKNFAMALSNSVINQLKAQKSIAHDIAIDGNVNDWDLTKTSYGVDETNRETLIANLTYAGRSFKVWAFKGTNGIYVLYEVKHTTLVNKNAAGDWFNSFNAEMYPNGTGHQIYASVTNDMQNVRNVAFNIGTTQSGGLYTSYVELLIPFGILDWDVSAQYLKVGFAAKVPENGIGMTENADGSWWCGPYHAQNSQHTKFMIGDKNTGIVNI